MPAYAQDGPGTGDTPTESTDPGTTETAPADTGGTTETGESTDPPAETAPAADPPAEESAPPPPDAETPAGGSTEEPAAPSEPAPPSETCTTTEEGAADGASSTCEPAAPAEGEADPAGDPDASCEDGTTAAQPASEGSNEPAPACKAVEDPGPAAATAPPPASTPASAPAPAPAAAETGTIVLIVGEPAAAAPVAPAPQNADLANLLLPLLAGAVTLSGGASEAAVVLGVSAAIAGEPADAAESQRSFAASMYEGVALAERQAPPVESVLTANVPLYPTMDKATGLPAPVTRLRELQRPRRTHPEARADAEPPTVAVAQAPSRSDGRTGVSGGSTGGSAGSATQRIFVVSTLPLTLSAPVSFPTEPPPTLLPEGEPGIAPTASPG